MKKVTFKAALSMAAVFFTLNLNAQCLTISCPPNITENSDLGQCGAVINYTAPVGIDFCNSQSFTFTNCGVSGRLGPTQAEVTNEYSGGPLAGQVTINTQGIQEWTIPYTGMYTIEVAGAKGGDATGVYEGGLGALMKGDFQLTAGDLLKIAVGQKGENTSYAGGGGGSFVSFNNNPLIIAGGGGGGNSITNKNNGYDAVTGTDGVASFTPGGTGGNGANGGMTQGGAGYLSDGLNLGSSGTAAAQSLLNGAAGGHGYGNYWGGFGGGGAGFGGGGGGGGYSGGSGGKYTVSVAEAPGGGGGSFNSGTNQFNSAGVNSSHGYVTITYNGTVTTTQTAGLASGLIFPVGTTTNSFEVSDGSGASILCSFDVVVEDIEAPEPDITSLPDLVAECKIYSLDQATATDNCDGTVYGSHNMSYPITSSSTLIWTFVDAAGNTSTQTQEVIISGLNVDVTVNDPTLIANNSQPGITYQWIDCVSGISIAGANGQSFTPIVNGDYAVVVTYDNCINVSSCYGIYTVSVSEESTSKFKLYPNPNNGQFIVESVSDVERFTVVDGSGRIVFEGTPKSTSFEVNLNAYDSGMYFLHVNDKVMKVVKQ